MPTCEMFGMFQLDAALRIWQANYCESDFARCARYEKSCRADRVPINLLPNGKLLHKEPNK